MRNKNYSTRLFFIIAFCMITGSSYTQFSTGGEPISSLMNIGNNFQTVEMPAFDVQAMIAEDYMNALKGDVPYRYGKVFEVNLSLNNSGTWVKLNDGSRIWRLAIYSRNAISINLFYKDFRIPQGALFYIYNPEKTNLHGAFTEFNNNEKNEFATAPTLGNTTILEYYEPVHAIGKGRITVSQVVHAYRDIYGYLNTEELACNININCPIGAPWVNQKRAVTRITFTQGGGGYLCSGSLVNNTAQDRKLYYLTAEHCSPDNHNSMVFYFNYENPTCWGTGGSLSQTLSGATFRAALYGTDFRLVEINGPLPASYNAYFNGWDRSGVTPLRSTAIHHPGGANKKIAIDTHAAVNSNGFGGRLPNGFWRVIWDHGMTEGGSSGCPLYDQNKRVVGQNLGGTPSNCDNPQGVLKYFGKFSVSWDYGGSPSTQLKDWLDPLNTAPLTLDGINDQTGVAPVSNFTSDTANLPLGGGTVNFFDLTTNDPTSWSWSFPGGTPSTSTAQNPTGISYTATGAYTVSLTTSNAYGANTKTIVAYIRVAGAPMNNFSLVSPPNNTTITVASNDPSTVDFNWTRSGTSPTLNYKFWIKKIGTTVEYIYPSNNNGQDSVKSLRKSFLDSLAVTMGTTGDSVRCSWRVFCYNGLDSLVSSNTFLVTLKRLPIGIIKIGDNIPDRFALYNNYPNPFNPVTVIRFDVARMQMIKLRVYNYIGQELFTLINEELNPGTYSYNFDASTLASGVYFYALETEGFRESKKMVVLK
jgi:lysyl endopeptidase